MLMVVVSRRQAPARVSPRLRAPKARRAVGPTAPVPCGTQAAGRQCSLPVGGAAAFASSHHVKTCQHRP